ncbi:MAG: hypothetical protein RDU01_06250 [Thermodesulfovibrionales bacterium]|nr:hypothetical protein [Thermodesulfovibrionales bacterium]
MEKIQKISGFILSAILLVWVFVLFSGPVSSPDFWWHLKSGEYICQTKSLPDADPFSYTAVPEEHDGPSLLRIKFILQQYWLAQVIFFQTFHYAGFKGIIFLRAAVLSLLICLLYRILRKERFGALSATFLTTPFVAVLFYGYTAERPQFFSFLFAFLLIFLMEGFRKAVSVSTSLNESQRVPILSYLLPVPFLMLLWANMHGGFIIGIAIIFGYLFAETVKYVSKKFGNPLPRRAFAVFSLIGFLSLLLVLINPNGFSIIPFLVHYESGTYKSMITETISPFRQLSLGFYSPELIIYFVLLLVSIVVMVLNRKKLDMTDAIIFGGIAFLSLKVSRTNPFFVPVALLMIGRYSLPAIDRFRCSVKEKILGNSLSANQGASVKTVLSFVLSALVLFGMVKGNSLSPPIASVFSPQYTVVPNKYPAGAAQFLKENRLPQNLFNPYDWGGYLIWASYPDYRVFVDGRGLQEKTVLDERKIMGASAMPAGGLPEWKALLDQYHVHTILTFSVDAFSGQLVPFIPVLLHDPQWHLVYMDNISLIFIKNIPENQSLINTFSIPKEWLWNEVITEAILKMQGFWSRPVEANFHKTLGDAYLAKTSFREAKWAYARAFALDPGNNAAKNKLILLERYGY